MEDVLLVTAQSVKWLRWFAENSLVSRVSKDGSLYSFLQVLYTFLVLKQTKMSKNSFL